MVPPSSHGVSRVPRYSGYCLLWINFAYGTLTPYGMPSHAFRLSILVDSTVRTPKVFLPSVWPLPRSLATTCGISFDFFSSPYLDVSVQAVPHIYLCIQYMLLQRYLQWVSPFGHLRIIARLQLPVAFRSLPRPSSALSAKAFTLRSS